MTCHRTIMQCTCTEEQPPRLILTVIERRGANVGSYLQTLAVRSGLLRHLSISGLRTRSAAANVSRAVVDDAVEDMELLTRKLAFGVSMMVHHI